MNKLGIIFVVIFFAGCGGDSKPYGGQSQSCRQYPAQYMVSGKTYACEWIAAEFIHHCFNEDNASTDNHYASEADFIREFSKPGLFTRLRTDFLDDGQPFYHSVYDYDDAGALLSVTTVSDIPGFEELLNSMGVYTSHDDYGRPLTGIYTSDSVSACPEGIITNTYDDLNRTFMYSFDFPDDCTDQYIEYALDDDDNIINMSFAGDDFPITILSTEVLCEPD